MHNISTTAWRTLTCKYLVLNMFANISHIVDNSKKKSDKTWAVYIIVYNGFNTPQIIYHYLPLIINVVTISIISLYYTIDISKKKFQILFFSNYFDNLLVHGDVIS